MSVTQAQICNLALARLNITKTAIANLTSDTGNVAAQCRIHYDAARRFVLADHPWNFATKRETLADLGNPPADWLFRYRYPGGALRVFRIERDFVTDPVISFKIEQREDGNGLCVLTNRVRAVAIFGDDVTNTALFAPGFVTAFSWYLASELAPALTGDRGKQEDALTVYRSLVRAAQAQDSLEGQPALQDDAPWERARSGHVS